MGRSRQRARRRSRRSRERSRRHRAREVVTKTQRRRGRIGREGRDGRKGRAPAAASRLTPGHLCCRGTPWCGSEARARAGLREVARARAAALGFPPALFVAPRRNAKKEKESRNGTPLTQKAGSRSSRFAGSPPIFLPCVFLGGVFPSSRRVASRRVTSTHAPHATPRISHDRDHARDSTFRPKRSATDPPSAAASARPSSAHPACLLT